MKISSNNYSQYFSEVSSRNNLKGVFSQAKLSTTKTTGADEIQISKKGQMMGRMMTRMQQMDKSQMKSRIQSFEQKMDDLNIGGIDPNTMSDEELNETLSKIQDSFGQAVGTNLGQDQTLDIESLSEDEKREMLSTFKDNVTQIQENLDHMKSMMSGMRMPGMGGQKMTGMSGIGSLYSEEGATDEDTFQILLDALESEQNSELSSDSLYDTLLNTLNGDNEKEE